MVKPLLKDHTVQLFFFFAIASLLGLIISGALSTAETPVLENQYVTVWYAAMSCFSSLQAAYVYRYTNDFTSSSLIRFLNCLYAGIVFLVAIMSFVCYCILRDAGGIVFNLLGIILNGIILRFLFKKNPESLTHQGSAGARCLVCFNGLLKILHLLFCCLLLNGAITSASVKTMYKAPGKVYSVQQTDGRTALLHVFCNGTVNNSLPVIWVTSSSAHGVVDFYGLQYFLTERGRRVCTMDLPGFGWSGPVLSNQSDSMLFFDPLVQATGEKTPILLVGWGGGAGIIANYTRLFPNKVAGIAFLEVAPPDIEFLYYASKNNLNSDQLRDYRKRELQGRLGLVSIILSLAIPWGLMSIFAPVSSVGPGYFPPEKRAEFKSMSWVSSMWLNQYWGLVNMQQQNMSQDPLNQGPFPSSIPFAAIKCNLSDSQLCEPQNGRTKTEEECKEQIQQNKFYSAQTLTFLKSLQPNVTIIDNTFSNCSLGLPVDSPYYTTNAILQTLGNITI
jgi:pimeloyl-ACP methyl ester carboxylesterase